MAHMQHTMSGRQGGRAPHELEIAARMVVGAERTVKIMMQSLLSQPQPNYPPYNLVRTGDHTYRIEMALAGIPRSALDIAFKPGELSIRYQPEHDDAKDHAQANAASADGPSRVENSSYIHRGISQRSFHRVFPLVEGVDVKRAAMKNGMLIIDLEQVVPAETVQRITIE